MHYRMTIPVYAPYSQMVARYPVSYDGGYEQPAWERFEEQFHPPWLKQLERQMGIKPGREPLWWELFEEQFEPPSIFPVQHFKFFRAMELMVMKSLTTWFIPRRNSRNYIICGHPS